MAFGRSVPREPVACKLGPSPHKRERGFRAASKIRYLPVGAARAATAKSQIRRHFSKTDNATSEDDAIAMQTS
jgi:hypothetical protein